MQPTTGMATSASVAGLAALLLDGPRVPSLTLCPAWLSGRQSHFNHTGRLRAFRGRVMMFDGYLTLLAGTT